MRNVTLSLPEPLLREFKIYAAQRNQSMTALMTEAIEKMVRQREDDRAARKARFVERIKNAPDLGTNGKASWTREELHER